MRELGKCFLFYLKYPAEMQRLYEMDDPDTSGLPDPEHTLAKIRSVGDTARRQGAELLEQCAVPVEQYFSSLCKLKRRRPDIPKNWYVEFVLFLNKTNETLVNVTVGISIDENQSQLVPWLWRRGRRRHEDEVIRILGKGKRMSVDDWEAGTIGLDEIPIPIPDSFDHSLDCTPLIDRVAKAFSSVTVQQLERIEAINSNEATD